MSLKVTIEAETTEELIDFMKMLSDQTELADPFEYENVEEDEDEDEDDADDE